MTVTIPAARNIPTRIPAASRAAHASRAFDDEPVAERPVAELGRDHLAPALGVGGRRTVVVKSRSIVVEPYAVRTATPIAIPIIRATVTIALAIPNDARPGALDRGRAPRSDRQSEPEPEQPPRTSGHGPDRDGRRPLRHQPERRRARGRAPRRSRGAGTGRRTAKPGQERADGRRAGQRIRAPGAGRPGPPYRTRSTNTAPPMIAVANA